ncbi:hypothetical protein [Arthrobacter sp. SRS-W-1-2016]|uniref:hypothetical protein n=1 Tax=Arthrobacter sp. SRS-W-1-2016 TaxID=1930254 RepID=UPI001116E787|nr:hypothetical protein [Arthrobacter sp. SRS-W-1-2016]
MPLMAARPGRATGWPARATAGLAARPVIDAGTCADTTLRASVFAPGTATCRPLQKGESDD